MRLRILMMVLVASLGGVVPGRLAAQEGTVIELTAPRMPRADEGAEVQITAGRLPPGARVELLDEQGAPYGALAVVGPRGRATATVPIPRSALVNGRLRVRLRVLEPGAPPRAPRSDEIESLILVLAPQSR